MTASLIDLAPIAPRLRPAAHSGEQGEQQAVVARAMTALLRQRQCSLAQAVLYLRQRDG